MSLKDSPVCRSGNRSILVCAGGFDPPTTRFQGEDSTRLSYAQFIWLARQVLPLLSNGYRPLSLLFRTRQLVGLVGNDPTTFAMSKRRSTSELKTRIEWGGIGSMCSTPTLLQAYAHYLAAEYLTIPVHPNWIYLVGAQ